MLPRDRRALAERRLEVLMAEAPRGRRVDATILRAFRAYARLREFFLATAAIGVTMVLVSFVGDGW